MTALDYNIDTETEEDGQRDAFLVDQRMKALASVYQLADSIIAGENINVKVGESSAQAPAWTTGTEIFINSSALDIDDFDDLVRLHGLNFHELSHVLYTPRQGTNLAQYCMEEGLMPAFNLLEDQRIESMITTKYPSTAPWLTAAVMRWVTSEPSAMDKGYLFVRGRRYLPGELRGMLRSMFERRDLLSDIDRIVDTYRLLVFPTDYDAAKPLIERMQRILNELGSTMPSDPNGHCESPWHICDKGRPAPVKEQRSLRDRMGRESSKKDSEPTEKAEGEGSATDVDGMSGDNEDAGDSSTPSSLPSEQAQDSSPGTGTAENNPAHDRAREQVKKMLDDLLNSSEVTDDIKRTRKTIENSVGAAPLPQARFWNVEPMPDYVFMERRLTQTMMLLQEEAEPGWHRREDFGRLNVVRWTIERDVTEAFDRWDEGVTDAVDIEAVILLDASGSMSGIMEEASNAMWVLKRAFDAVDISTTVIAYDGSSETLYDSQERATLSVRQPSKGGGTNPIGALSQAARIFDGSRRKNKMLITLTDGQWSRGQDQFGLSSEDYIKRMGESGVVTALGFIDSLLQDRINAGVDIEDLVERNRHNCQIAGLADGTNLVPFISDIVTGLIRSRIRGAR